MIAARFPVPEFDRLLNDKLAAVNSIPHCTKVGFIGVCFAQVVFIRGPHSSPSPRIDAYRTMRFFLQGPRVVASRLEGWTSHTQDGSRKWSHNGWHWQIRFAIVVVGALSRVRFLHVLVSASLW